MDSQSTTNTTLRLAFLLDNVAGLRLAVSVLVRDNHRPGPGWDAHVGPAARLKPALPSADLGWAPRSLWACGLWASGKDPCSKPSMQQKRCQPQHCSASPTSNATLKPKGEEKRAPLDHPTHPSLGLATPNLSLPVGRLEAASYGFVDRQPGGGRITSLCLAFCWPTSPQAEAGAELAFAWRLHGVCMSRSSGIREP